MKWKPIETAPKDGTKILTARYNLSLAEWDYGVVKWVNGTWTVFPTRDMRLSLLGDYWVHILPPPHNKTVEVDRATEAICERCGYPKDTHPRTTCWGEEPPGNSL